MKNTKNTWWKASVLIILLFGLSSSCNHEDKPVKTVDEPKEIIISTEQAKEMYDTYTIRRKGLIQDFENSLDNRDQYDEKDQQGQNQKGKEEKASISSGSEGFQVARYINYDYNDLKQYMAFIEQEAKKANVEISTLRFYLTNYPNKEKFDDGGKIKDPRRNTVIMVPSLNKGGKEYAFFTANDSEDGMRKAFLLTEELNEDGTSHTEKGQQEKEKASFLPTITLPNLINAPIPPENKQSLYGNEGGLRPPS